MARNTYFNNSHSNEQDLYEDIIIESINIWGQNMFYIPRTLVAVDDIIGEDRVSQFNNAYPIVAYFGNIDSFAGSGAMMSKFGLSMEQSADLIISRKEWLNLVGNNETSILPNRPAEGDLIYFPLTKGLFEIKFVQHQDPFYQLGKLYTWKLSIELFQYSSESIDTGNNDIDIFETLKTFSVDTTDNITGRIMSVTMDNFGNGYLTPPNITFDSITGNGATAIAILGTGATINKVIRIDVTSNGTGYTNPTNVIITGSGNGATAIANVDINIDVPDSFGDNNKFRTKAKPIIFNEANPFGDL